MGFLKVFGTVICCIILFLALSVFSVAFLLNNTVLNADFMTSRIDKLDFSAIAGGTVEEQITGEIPQGADFLSDVASEIITAQEPLIKQQIHTGIDSAYAYLLEKDTELNITVSLVEIKQNIKDTIWQTAVDYLNKKLSGMSDEESQLYIQDIVSQIPEDVLPPELAALPDDLRAVVIEQYVREIAGLEPTVAVPVAAEPVKEKVKIYFERYFDSYIEEIPDTYTIDESTMDQDTLASFNDAKRAINYFQAAYIWLIVIMVVAAGLIFLINWSNVKTSVRALGIDLLVFGVLDLAGILIIRGMKGFLLDNSGLSASMQSWLESLLNDMAGILVWFSIGVLILGAILLVLSFFIKRREASA